MLTQTIGNRPFNIETRQTAGGVIGIATQQQRTWEGSAVRHPEYKTTPCDSVEQAITAAIDLARRVAHGGGSECSPFVG